PAEGVEQRVEVELRVARLQPGRQRVVEAGVEVGVGDRCRERGALRGEPVLERRRAGIDGLLRETDLVWWERRDAARERVDERTDLVRRERAVDPAVAFRHERVEVRAPSNDL